jgi:uncharacterized iron-regulated membrane protein
MPVRKILFWVHLVAGVISGLSIAIMCFTGTVLAFDKEITAWSERDARRAEQPAPGAPRLSLDELQGKLRDAQPDAKPVSIIMQNDPNAAVAFSAGRTGGHYVNPYTGEVRQPASSSMSTFMREMVEWHRYLNFNGDVSRPRGKWINGVCNIAFCMLAVTGLYLWMPRSWSWRSLRPIVWFRQNTTSKARDFNWHNAIGFWTAPVLIVLTLTAVPISFRWGGNLIYTLTGTPAPIAGSSGPGGSAAAALLPLEIPAPPPGSRALGHDALLAAVQKHMPDWQTITLRLSAGGGEGRGGGRPAASSTPPSSGSAPLSASETRGRSQPVTVTVRERATWPRTATTTLTLNPYNGDVLRDMGYADMNAAQRVRSWTRFLHTGEALGWMGQLVAGIACLGGVFLVYTGFALSWRRFFGKRTPDKRQSQSKPPSHATTADALQRDSA